MPLLAVTAVSLALAVPLCAAAMGGQAPDDSSDSPPPSGPDAKAVSVSRAGSQASIEGPSEWFTGTVRIDWLFQAEEPSRVSSATVTFEPGARTAWHTHPLGQRLVVTAGAGWVQEWGGPVHLIRPGDVATIPPGKKHWHGATATTAMSHIAIQESLDGQTVEWMEKVSDEQYAAGASAE